MNWKKGKELYGPIKRGQKWKKRDTGRVMMIENRKGDVWRVIFVPLSGNPNHTLNERDIYAYYQKLL